MIVAWFHRMSFRLWRISEPSVLFNLNILTVLVQIWRGLFVNRVSLWFSHLADGWTLHWFNGWQLLQRHHGVHYSWKQNSLLLISAHTFGLSFALIRLTERNNQVVGEGSSRRRRRYSLHSLPPPFQLVSAPVTPPRSAAPSLRVKHFQYRDQSAEFLALSGAETQRKQKPHSRLPQITSSQFTHNTAHCSLWQRNNNNKKKMLASSKCMLPLVGSGVILHMKGCGF